MAKKYSINVENDRIISIEVDGIQYASPDEIPDLDDRAKMLLITENFPDMDWDLPESELETKPFIFPKLIVPLFLAVSLLMLTIASFSAYSTLRLFAREQNAPGRVTELAVRRDSDGKPFYYPVIEFTLPDNRLQTVLVPEGSWPPAYEVGEAVTVAYDPQQPESARIRSTSSTLLRLTVSLITGILGIAFLIATLFARWVLKPEPADTTPDQKRLSLSA